MLKNINNVFRFLTVIGIVFALRVEAGTDSSNPPEKSYGPTISIPSRFEFADDTVMIPIEFRMPFAVVSGFQFKLNTTPRILEFVQIVAGNSIAGDTTWQVFGNVQADSSVQILGVNMADDCLEAGIFEIVNVKAVISSSAEYGRHFISISDGILSDSLGDFIESILLDGELFVTKSGVLFTAYDNFLWADSSGNKVEIILHNKKPVAGFQFDVADSGNYFSVEDITANLPAGWTTQFNEIDSTTTRIVCAGFGQLITPNSEMAIYLDVDVNSSLKTDNYPFKIWNVVVSDSSGQPLITECVSESIHIINDSPIAIDPNGTPSGKLPDRFVLMQNYPNPFNSVTTIGFNIPAETNVHIEIFDILGRHIASLENGVTSAGFHRIFWNGTNVSGEHMNSGIYFIRMTAGQFSARRKIVLLK